MRAKDAFPNALAAVPPAATQRDRTASSAESRRAPGHLSVPLLLIVERKLTDCRAERMVRRGRVIQNRCCTSCANCAIAMRVHSANGSFSDRARSR